MGDGLKNENIWAVIPAYNAAVSIGAVVEGTQKYLNHVVVVNDGSKDRTAEAALRKKVILISIPKNRGKGFALRQGFRYALENGCSAILTIDADGQHDPEDIPTFIQAHRRDADPILIGSRMAEAGGFPRQRYYSNLAAAFFIARALHLPIEDTQCGFRLYPAQAIRSLTLTTTRFQTETEVLLRAARQGVRLSNVPVKNIYSRGNGSIPPSNFRPVRDTFFICMVVLRGYLGML